MKVELEKLDDASLHDMIREAKALLEHRSLERKKVALAEIRKLAAAVGMAIAVKEPKRKRGRPPNNARTDA